MNSKESTWPQDQREACWVSWRCCLGPVPSSGVPRLRALPWTSTLTWGTSDPGNWDCCSPIWRYQRIGYPPGQQYGWEDELSTGSSIWSDSWVGLTTILVVPPTARFCFGCCEFAEHQNAKSAQPYFPTTWTILYSAWVDEAVFYSEAELTIMNLLLQRRRWINGKFSGHVYMLRRLDRLFASHNPLWRKLSCTMMAVIQVTAFLVSYLSVAIFGGAFHHSSEYLSENLGLSPLLPHYITSVYVTIYILLILCHTKKWENDQRFSLTLWRVAFIVNGLLMIISLVSMSLYFIKAANHMLQCFAETFNEDSQYLNRVDIEELCSLQHQIHGPALIKLIVVICVTSFTILNTLLSNHTSFCIIANPVNTLVFTLALPTFTAFFPAYAISRYADLTWGQRPTVDQQCILGWQLNCQTKMPTFHETSTHFTHLSFWNDISPSLR